MKIKPPFIQNGLPPKRDAYTPDGKEITVADVERIYIRSDQGKAYWVKGKETGEVELW